MKIEKKAFFHTGTKAKISNDQLGVFWNLLEEKSKENTTSVEQLLFYLGACIVIASMTLFMSWGGSVLGSLGILLISIGYALFFTAMGTLLWRKKGQQLAGGVLITLAVCMTPLIIYSVQNYFHLWVTDTQQAYADFFHVLSGNWIFMEIGTILTGILAFYFFPFSFLTAPISLAFLFLSLDLTYLLFENPNSDLQCSITLLFGLCLLGIGRFCDKKIKTIDGFWAYLFGTIAFWGGLGCLVWDRAEWILAIYLIINILMMFFGILLERSVLIIFGAIGTFAYLSHLAYQLFGDSLLFPFILSLIGLLVIFLGILYQRNRELMQRHLLKKFAFLRKFL